MSTPPKNKKKTGSTQSRPAAAAAFSRRTITIPPEMEAAIDALVGHGRFSAFAQQAFTHELQRETIARWLDERETARNGEPLPGQASRFAERAWRSRA